MSVLSKSPAITRQPFGKTKTGTAELYTLRGADGIEAKITNYGGTVVSLLMPDRDGRLDDVVLGYDSLETYLKDTSFFGALIGRFGNRIAKGRFTLAGKSYQLPINSPPNSLHGGVGFDKVFWEARPITTADGPALQLHHVSPDGEQGYPGTLDVTATYTLTKKRELRLDCIATTDQDTIINLTQHSYFNLAGAGSGTILNHEVMINADRFTPVNKDLIPTGELRPVEGTPFDFRAAEAIGARIKEKDQQLTYGAGYDHNYALRAKGASRLRKLAKVWEPTTGRTMEVLSTEPGMQFYSGNVLTGKLTGKGGGKYPRHSGFCMEPQHFPNSPNESAFPSTVLKAGDTFKSTIIYRFEATK